MDIFIKIWILGLIKVLVRNGKKTHYIKIVEKIIVKFLNLSNNNFLDFYNLFLKLKNNMFLPLYLRTRIVAGRKVLIPIPFESLQKEVFLYYVLY